MRKLSTRLGIAGIGLALLTVVGCGSDSGGAPLSPGDSAGESEAAEPVVLTDVSGQQVCDLLSQETLATFVPEAQFKNSTVASTDVKKRGRCEAQGSTDTAPRTLAIEVGTEIPVSRGKPIAGATPEENGKEWLARERKTAEVANKDQPDAAVGTNHEAPEDMAVGDGGFTATRVYEDGGTLGRAYFHSGPWMMTMEYAGKDRPNPDDRDNEQPLQKDALVAAMTAMSTEIDGKLAALSGGPGKPTGEPGDLTGDVLCTALSDKVLEQYLPEAEDKADTGATEHSSSASCEWSSTMPRPDSPGLRSRDGRAEVMVWNMDPKGSFDQDRANDQEQHDAGPIKDGPQKGMSYTAPQDIPGLGQAAWIRLTHSGPDVEHPSTYAKIKVLLIDNRILTVSYGGSDLAELDTGQPDEGDLGTSQAPTDEEVIAGARAIADDVLAMLG